MARPKKQVNQNPEHQNDQPAEETTAADREVDLPNPSKGSKVIKEFRDKDNFIKVWKVGEDVSHFDKDRLKKLIVLGLVK